MEPTTHDKMDEFLEKAEDILKYTKEQGLTNEEKLDNGLKAFNKKVNFFIASVLTVILFMLGLVSNTRVEVVKKADAQEVMYKKNALTLEKLRLDNNERNFAVFADTTCKMELVKEHNENYLWHVVSIFDINYRGDR